jgi:hypothetical protein
MLRYKENRKIKAIEAEVAVVAVVIAEEANSTTMIMKEKKAINTTVMMQITMAMIKAEAKTISKKIMSKRILMTTIKVDIKEIIKEIINPSHTMKSTIKRDHLMIKIQDHEEAVVETEEEENVTSTKSIQTHMAKKAKLKMLF